jgi:hypothetical protein
VVIVDMRYAIQVNLCRWSNPKIITKLLAFRKKQ